QDGRTQHWKALLIIGVAVKRDTTRAVVENGILTHHVLNGRGIEKRHALLGVSGNRVRGSDSRAANQVRLRPGHEPDPLKTIRDCLLRDIQSDRVPLDQITIRSRPRDLYAVTVISAY